MNRSARPLAPVAIIAAIIASIAAAITTVFFKGQYCLPIFSGAGLDALLHLDPYAAREGRPDLFKYGPIWSILMAPLAALPPSVAPFFWAILNAICFWAAVLIFKKDRSLSALELVLLFPLVLANGFYGQINSLLLWLIVLMLDGMKGHRALRGGLAGAAAIWMKLFPAALVLFALKRPRSSRFWLGLTVGLVAGALIPIIHWGAWIFESWFKILQHDLANPHHKIGLMALLIQSGIGESLAKLINQWAAGLALLGIAWAVIYGKGSRSRDSLEALLITCFLIFSHMTEPPTLALLAPAVIVASRLGIKRTLPLVLLLVILPSDLTPPAIKAGLGGNYGIKTLALIYAAFLLAFTRDPGLTKSPG